jgi:drug/metabolite transporter (DMT)-like permease
MSDPASRPPSPAATVLAFGLVYLCWGTTYLAIREGVKDLPPALFGGVRVGLAGLLLLGYLAWRGQPVRLSRRDLLWAAIIGCCFFVGGNYLVTLGERTLESGTASVLAATTPLWMALFEFSWPRGERLTGVGWLGLVTGMLGVVVLMGGHPTADTDSGVSLVAGGLGMAAPAATWWQPGPWLVLGSALAWAFGTFLMRHRRRGGPGLATAAYQMALGGGAVVLVGLALGEAGRLTPEHLTVRAGLAFCHLLVFGSLVGFLAYSWLVEHVSSAMVGTYSYVNPAVAVLIGWLFAGEAVTLPMLAGMALILGSVALVRAGSRKARAPEATKSPEVNPPRRVSLPDSA